MSLAQELDFSQKVIAHRGFSAAAPENTMAAFTKAAEAGIRWVEFDVMLAACGEIVVFHDELLDRTTNGHGLVQDYTYGQLRQLDAGRWFNAKFAGERIPTLKQVLDFLATHKMSANIEVKGIYRQEELVQHVLAIASMYPNLPVLFSSFSLAALRQLRQLAPQCHIGFLIDDWENGWEKIVEELKPTCLDVNHLILTPEKVVNIKMMNKFLLSYTINESARAHELFAWGVDGVFSDNCAMWSKCD